MYVQYSDASHAEVVSVFSSMQDDIDNLVELDTSSDAYKTFYNLMPDVIQQLLPSPT